MSIFWNHVVSKFWNDVESRLITREGSIYFAGGTLVMDTDNGIICFNLDGKGFISHTQEFSYFKNGTIYLPDHILELVRKIYLDVKGSTEHYTTEVNKKLV